MVESVDDIRRFLGWAFLLVLFVTTPLQGDALSSDAAPVSVLVGRPRVDQIRRWVRATGSVVPAHRYVISSQGEGLLRQLPVDVGDVVSQGMVVARLENVVAQHVHERARATLTHRESTLRRVIAVTPGEVSLAHAASKRDLAVARSELALAARERDSRESLSSSGMVPSHELEVARATYDTIRSRVAYLEAEVAYRASLVDQEVWSTTIEQARAERDMAYHDVALSSLALQRLDVKSPTDGVVVERLVDLGASIVSGTPLLTIIDPDRLVVDCFVDETSHASVQIGQKVMVSVLGKAWEGRVHRVSVERSRETGGFWVRVTLPADDGLVSGKFVICRILVETRQESVLIPRTAVIDTGRGPVVFVVDPHDRVHRRSIDVGWEEGDFVEVLQGLSVEDVVVVEGGYGLRDGGLVTVLEDRDSS